MARRRVLPTAGSPERPMQLVHAADLAEALVAAAEHDTATGVFHVAEPTRYRWSEVLRLVGEAVNRRPMVVRVPDGMVRMAAAVSEKVARGLGRAVIFDRDKARELLAPGWTCETESARLGFGFEASIPLAAGLNGTAQWYRAYGWL
jgi:nucleoside-diphosphate-sugar epimerase